MIEDVVRLAEEAGQKILKYYFSGDWSVASKDDKSPLTQADLAANEILVRGLESLSKDKVISEESDPRDREPTERFWLVDPLDGTRDFVAKLDTFVVSIGLIENGYPIKGVIHSPVLGKTWWAEVGQGAWSSDRERIQNRSERYDLIAAGSRSMPSERMQIFYDHFSIREVIRFGSALKFCRLGEGEVDLYPRFGPTYEWDTAAGQIIAEEAGCKVLDISTGERLKYAKPGLLNQGGFMASRADLDLLGPLRASGHLRPPKPKS